MITTEKGRIVKRFEMKQGQRRDGSIWKRQDILFEVSLLNNDSVTRRMVLSANEEVMDILDIVGGNTCEVDFILSARDWQGKWFNNANIIDIRPEKVYSSVKDLPEYKKKEEQQPLEPEEGDLPF